MNVERQIDISQRTGPLDRQPGSQPGSQTCSQPGSRPGCQPGVSLVVTLVVSLVDSAKGRMQAVKLSKQSEKW